MKFQKIFVLFSAVAAAVFLAMGSLPASPPDVLAAGEVIPVFTGTATEMLGRVVSGAPGTAIYNNGSNWVMFSSLADRGYMFLNITLDPATQKVSLSQIFNQTGGGNFTTYKTASDFRLFLEGIGFSRVTREALPPALVAEVVSKASPISTALLNFKAPMFIVLFSPMIYEDFINQVMPDARVVIE